jgi:hypothetical protein
VNFGKKGAPRDNSVAAADADSGLLVCHSLVRLPRYRRTVVRAPSCHKKHGRHRRRGFSFPRGNFHFRGVFVSGGFSFPGGFRFRGVFVSGGFSFPGGFRFWGVFVSGAVQIKSFPATWLNVF